MSGTRDFVLRSDTEFSIQLSNFSNELSTLGASLGITPAQITAAQADAAAFAFAVAAKESIKEYAKGFTRFKEGLRSGKGPSTPAAPTFALPAAPPAVPEGVEQRFRDLAARIRTAPNYTEAIGAQLGIVAPQASRTPEADAQPAILGLALSGGKVILRWKKGAYDGIYVYRKIDGGAYEHVGVDTKPDWEDRRPMPATTQVWTYKIIYFLKDIEIGRFSAEASISVVG